MPSNSPRQDISWKPRGRPFARLQVEGDWGGSALNQSRSLAATPRCPDAAGRVFFFFRHGRSAFTCCHTPRVVRA